MKIICVYLMRIAGYPKVYVGSTNNFKNRKHNHQSKLARNKHNNIFLQRVFNKHGENNLIFEILEIIDNPKILRERELYWINFYDSANNKKGFNLIKNPISYERSKPLTTKQHKTALKAMEKAHAKTFILFNPKGKKIAIFNLAKFCRKHNLNYNAMMSVTLNRVPEYKGWKKDLHRTNQAFKTYIFYNPNGEQIKITNLKKFCRENNLTYQEMNDLAHSKGKSHKGWSFHAPEPIKTYKFRNPVGQIFECENLKHFAIVHNLSPSMLSLLSRGITVSHKRWTSADFVRKDKRILSNQES